MSLGRVKSLHLHPPVAGEPMIALNNFSLIADQGIATDHRYFGRDRSSSDKTQARHCSLIAREQLADHAAAFSLPEIAPGAARANIETEGIDLNEFVSQKLCVGSAVLIIEALRTPCAKMDAIVSGLHERMKHGRQGVMARVLQSGDVRVGDTIEPCDVAVMHAAS